MMTISGLHRKGTAKMMGKIEWKKPEDFWRIDDGVKGKEGIGEEREVVEVKRCVDNFIK